MSTLIASISIQLRKKNIRNQGLITMVTPTWHERIDGRFTTFATSILKANNKGWGFESPSGRDIFCLNNFDTFTRTSVHVSKMNDVARAQ